MKLKSIKPYKRVEARLPRRVLPVAKFAYRTYMKVLCWYVGLQDRRYAERTGARLPPTSLRYRVHGSPSMDGFLRVGETCSENIRAALEKVGKNLDSFQNVLDFGCGCGRTLIWFADRSQSAHWYGTDIDAESIAWCRNNVDFAEFGVNDPLPPLRYVSETFDLIYAISVFTHLDEDYQFRWLDELERVTIPGGIVLLTVSGRRIWKHLPQEDVADIRKEGFKFTASNTAKGIFPEWYQNAYHTKEYVLDRYSKYFNVLDYVPRGMGNQDLVVLQKP
jgi:cyclopropane fatty-acyl-phospholipid synthase-like methyltransferase